VVETVDKALTDGGSESDREVESLGTTDTGGISEFGNAGQVHYDDTKCLVRLLAKVNN
jgi:hypothetical protein